MICIRSVKSQKFLLALVGLRALWTKDSSKALTFDYLSDADALIPLCSPTSRAHVVYLDDKGFVWNLSPSKISESSNTRI